MAHRPSARLIAWLVLFCLALPLIRTLAQDPKPIRFTDEQRQFWSLQPIHVVPPPAVRHTAWPKNAIDNFVLAGLESRRLETAPHADKRTLIRRATFDLIGLPPTPDEIDHFLADDSPDAFARVVDRLLNSPHYGERWGRHWLDVVRYTDSFDSRILTGDGSIMDCTEVWRYRDWVVEAFNRDIPYDQFIIDQVAGDIVAAKLAERNPEKFDAARVIATGMLAIGNWGGGDADKEKLLTDIVDDQVDLVGRAFLGLTIGCARCHDHKFDPIATEDYYGLAGIFFSSHILRDPGPKTNGPPMLRIPLGPPAELARRNERERRMTELQKAIEQSADDQITSLARSVLPQTARYLVAAWEYKNRASSSPGGEGLNRTPSPLRGEGWGEGSLTTVSNSLTSLAVARQLNAIALERWIEYLGFGEFRLLDKPVRDLLGNAGLNVLKGETDTPSITVNSTDREVKFITITLPPQSVAVHPSPIAGVAVAWKSPISGTVRVAGRVADGDGVCGNGIEWTISHRRSGTLSDLASGAIPNGGSQLFAEANGAERLESFEVRTGDMVQLGILPKGEYSCDTTVIELTVHELGGDGRDWNLTREVVPDLYDGGRGTPHSDALGNRDVWYFFDLAGEPTRPDMPGDSSLARWFAAVDRAAAGQASRGEVEQAAEQVQQALIALRAQMDESGSLQSTSKRADVSGVDAKLYKDLTAPRGRFWSRVRNDERAYSSDARALLDDLRRELTGLQKNTPPPLPLAVGCMEGGCPESPQSGTHDVYVHMRGRYDKLGDLVPRRFPIILAGDNQPPITAGSGRLDLARWLTLTRSVSEDPNQRQHDAVSATPSDERALLPLATSLTARVMVNRLWQHHFGSGIVRTPGNFGKLGERPTHPELLDYLADLFVRSGWSIKAMHRAIMLSATYQQSSMPDPATLAADPDNRLFGRMNRRRLDAESIRDSLLAVSGQLDRTAGGPAVAGFDSPRRTLYVRTVRSDRSTFRELFDAADSTAIVDKRSESTVAPQSLYLLNHPFAQAQVKSFAQRLADTQPCDDASRIERLFVGLLGRPPSSREMDVALSAVIQVPRDGLSTEADTSTEAKWEQLCHVLVCTNEFLYVD